MTLVRFTDAGGQLDTIRTISEHSNHVSSFSITDYLKSEQVRAVRDNVFEYAWPNLSYCVMEVNKLGKIVSPTISRVKGSFRNLTRAHSSNRDRLTNHS